MTYPFQHDIPIIEHFHRDICGSSRAEVRCAATNGTRGRLQLFSYVRDDTCHILLLRLRSFLLIQTIKPYGDGAQEPPSEGYHARAVSWSTSMLRSSDAARLQRLFYLMVVGIESNVCLRSVKCSLYVWIGIIWLALDNEFIVLLVKGMK